MKLSFKEGNKWFVNDGNESFYITVEDDVFLRKIDMPDVKFAKGDILKVKIRKQQFYNFDKKSLRSEYFVEKVLERKAPNKTGDLFENLWKNKLKAKNKSQLKKLPDKTVQKVDFDKLLKATFQNHKK